MVISYFRIFRYGSCLEIAVTVLGIFLGMLSSLGISYNFVQIGELSTSFIERTAYPQKLSSYLPLTQAFGGGRQLVNASHAENMAALIEDAKAMAIGMFITIAISILLCIGSIELTEWSSLRQITRIRMLFLQSLLRQDMTWFDTDTEFNLASSMSENLAKLKEGMGEKLGIVANLVGTALLCFSAALPLGWELCLACFAVTPFSLLACVVLSNYQTKSSKKQMESYSQAGKQAEEVLKSVKTVVAFAGENKEVDRHQRLLLPAMRYGQKKGFYTGLGNGFNWLLTYSLNAIGLSYGTRLVQRGDETPSGAKRYNFGTVFSILVTAYISTMSITQCVPHLEVFASASAAAAAIFELIDRKPKIDNLQESYHSLEGVKGDIIFEDVHFVYPSRPEVKVLKGLSMHVKSGENVALVGSSGCGKSTIIQVLQRLYDPIAGSVKLDGKDLKSINLSCLRSSLGVVGQEPALFRGTIHENIAIGRPKATREDVQRVAEMAYAHDFISRLANGYDTAIGERGASLSGGQKQRIAIARALLREPVILLLDEATSALDSHSERQVQAALDRASAGRTTIIVAHRLSTIVHAERIICLDKGVIVEQGNHVELMKAKGFYHNLVMRSNESHEPEESKSKVPKSTVPESTVPEYTVPESMVPESTVPESTVPETTVPESRVPETMVPETTVPETTVPESTVSESTVPESTVPESRVPETTAPETTVPETTIPETTVPESTLPESTGPESRVPEMTVPETTVPESTVPKLTVPESTVPEDHSSEKSPQIERTDKKNPPTIRLHRQISKRDSLNLTTPRDSIPITDVITTGNQNMCNSSVVEIEKEENEEIHDEEIKPISDWELMKLNAPEWMAITIGAIAAVIQGACFPVFAILFGYFSGIFAMPDQTNMVQLADLYSGICIVVAVIAGLCMCLQSVTFTSSGLKMSTRLRCQYFEALLRQEMAFYDKASNTVGAVCARLTGDTAEIQGATGLRIGIILQGISSVLIGVILAMFYNWKLALVSTALLPLMVGSIWLEGSMSKKSQADERAAMEDATAYATEAILSIKTVQSLGIEQLFLDKFRASLEIACAAVAKKSRFRGLVFGIGTYIPFMSYCSALVYGAVLVANGDIEYRVVLLVTQAIMYGAHILGQSLVFVPGFHSAKVCGARILHIIRREPAVKTEDKVKDNKDWAATGKFGLKDLEFSYPTRPNQKILHGINLKVEAGKTIAIVGSSGCGKSTILQLLQRFYDPDSGNIELDERDIRTGLTLPRLRRQLGVVQQEPVLFDRTIAENIAYGDNNREISMDEIVAAAKAANIHSFIISLPKGYETNLGSGGAQLSGGQKQRVCIARALIRSPRLLLLDEATSALDANSERVVADALDKAARGRTCITIAHRLSTIKDANLIFVLDKGRIVEKGTHSELISIKGHYWNLTRGHICLR